MIRLILAACAAALALAPVTSAGSSTPLTFRLYSFETQQCVEQQTPGGLTHCGDADAVVNPTPCVWTIDQWIEDLGTGDLAPGASASDSLCLIADGISLHRIRISVLASSPSLAVSVAGSDGEAYQIAPVQSGKQWAYNLCQVGPTFPSYPTVPGSNGGFGQRVDYTLAVGNPSKSAVRGISADWAITGSC